MGGSLYQFGKLQWEESHIKQHCLATAQKLADHLGVSISAQSKLTRHRNVLIESIDLRIYTLSEEVILLK